MFWLIVIGIIIVYNISLVLIIIGCRANKRILTPFKCILLCVHLAVMQQYVKEMKNASFVELKGKKGLEASASNEVKHQENTCWMRQANSTMTKETLSLWDERWEIAVMQRDTHRILVHTAPASELEATLRTNEINGVSYVSSNLLRHFHFPETSISH